MDPPSYHQQHQQSHDHEGAGATGTGSRSGGGGSYLCRQSSARWIPTGDQIRILRDLYYNYGVRSPSAEQIQRISAKLRQYGKIEGKNVFYWFQNHKARERQKKRLTADHISTSAASSAANGMSSASVASYDGGQFENGASLLGEKSFRGRCFVGGDGGGGTESGVGWFGIESAFQVAPWAYQCAVGSQELVTPLPAAVRAIETLPLFPIHAQEAEENSQHKSFCCDGMAKEENYGGYLQYQRGGGGGGTSLELTLNSYCYEPPSSM